MKDLFNPEEEDTMTLAKYLEFHKTRIRIIEEVLARRNK